ncbi:MAG: hypothetical protein QW266_01800 [Sulfolobales archaeon]
MTNGEDSYELEVLVYPDGRLLKVKTNSPLISVRDLLKVLEETGIPRDHYVIAAEGRILSMEECVQAGARVLLLPLVMGG